MLQRYKGMILEACYRLGSARPSIEGLFASVPSPASYWTVLARSPPSMLRRLAPLADRVLIKRVIPQAKVLIPSLRRPSLIPHSLDRLGHPAARVLATQAQRGRGARRRTRPHHQGRQCGPHPAEGRRQGASARVRRQSGHPGRGGGLHLPERRDPGQVHVGHEVLGLSRSQEREDVETVM